MTGDKDTHQLVEEGLTGAVIREQRVPIHVVKFALTWVREAKDKLIVLLCGIEAEKVVQPPLDRVSLTVPDWLIKLSLKEGTTTKGVVRLFVASLLVVDSHLVLLSQAVKKLK